MKTILFIFTMSMILPLAKAEHIPSWNCASTEIRLDSTVTDIGNKDFSQTLYTLRKTGSENDKSNFVVYFINAKKTISKCTRNFKSENTSGGSFDLTITSCEDEDDGEGIPLRNVASGVLKYSHGPLQGTEKVVCVFE